MPNQDLEHLRLLSIFHYIVGGLTAVFSLFPVFHLLFGLAMVLAPAVFDAEAKMPPALIGWFFILFAGAFIGAGWALAGVIIAAGRGLATRRWYTFCLVVAGVECLIMPLGTVLGVFTLIVLLRDSVKQLFADARSP